MLTEKQAWLEVAEAFYTPEDDRARRQRRIASCGICNAIDVLCFLSKIGNDTADRMDIKIKADLPPGSSWFCYPYRWVDELLRANELLRADYCMLQYYMIGGRR